MNVEQEVVHGAELTGKRTHVQFAKALEGGAPYLAWHSAQLNRGCGNLK